MKVFLFALITVLLVAPSITTVNGAQLVSDQPLVVVVKSPKSSLRNMSNFIDTAMEIRNATFDQKEQKLLFSFANKNSSEEEMLNLLSWDLGKNVPYAISAVPVSNGDVRLANPRLELLATWDDFKNQFTDQAYQGFHDAIEKIPAGSLLIPKELRNEIEYETVAAVVHAESINNSDVKKIATDLFYLQQKSYRGDQQISYSLFEEARSTCLATCAIRQKGAAKPHGSGVLIGTNLVLTCKHNFNGIRNGAMNCQAVFHFTDKDPGAAFTIANVVHSSEELDFCVLELGKQIEAADIPAFTLPLPPRIGVQPELFRHDGIYVAGHPGGRPLSVALNSHVEYPYWIDNQDSVSKLAKLTVMSMFSSPEEYESNKEKYLKIVDDFFSSSYQHEGANGFFFRPGGFPAIGADADTKSGDSGGPVFDVNRNSLVGLLRKGKYDEKADLPQGANYAFFELVIPISSIVAELNQKIPMWQQDFGVKFFENNN